MVTIFRPKEHRAKKNSAFVYGDKVSHDALHNCLSCVRWNICKDPSKGFNYRCSRYNENSIDNTSVDDHKDIHSLFDIPREDDPIKNPNVADDPVLDSRLDEIIATAISENSPIPPDIRINDAEIPLAPNFFTWLTDERFTGGGQPPFVRQVYVGSLLFADVCPRCSDMRWFERMKVDASLSRMQSKVVFLEKGKCPECKVDRLEFVEEGELANPNELILICGQRSAKTSSINLMDAYNQHRWLKLPNPAKVFRQLPQQSFTVTYTSKTFGQVRQNMWEPFLNILNGSPWFTNYHKFLTRRGQELGEELFNVADIYVRYRHRNLFISPASPSGQTMRGRTRLSAAIDEISHMPLQRSGGKEALAANAKDTYTALRNSLDTLNRSYEVRFNEGYFDLPKSIMYNASSPLTINDYGMHLLRQSRLSTKMLGFKYKTWEFNPTLPEEFFADRFRTNPVEAARDYACEPPIGQQTWLTDLDTIANAFGDKRNMYDIQQVVKKTQSKKKVTTAQLVQRLTPKLEWGCVLSIDVGSVNNSFAWAVSTVPNDFDLEQYVAEMEDEDAYEEADEDDVERHVGMVPLRTILVGEVIPNHEAEVSQTLLYRNVFQELCNELPIRLVISDRWQNKKLAQDMEDEFGVEYYEYKIKWEDFTNFKDALYEGLVTLPKLKTPMAELYQTTLDNYPFQFIGKPMEHLAYQFMTVQEARGNTVVKGDATDDMFRCIALAHAALQDKEMLRLLLDGEEEEYGTSPHLGLALTTTGRAGTVRSRANIAGSAILTPAGQTAPRAFLYRKR